jgi:protein phosphatase
MTALIWNVAAITDRGKRRTENQDHFYVSPDQRVFVVADGLGGELGGGTASKLTVEAINDFWKENLPPAENKHEIEKWLNQAIFQANERVLNTAHGNPSLSGMGTTIVIAVQSNNANLHIAHVGDSRAYKIKEGKAIPLTQDHSLVMELLLQGKLNADQARNSQMKNYITRCIGRASKIAIDQTPTKLSDNDWIILCSDGLSSVISDEEIGNVIQQFENPEDVCHELVQKTLSAGAPDNVTIIAVKYSIKQEALI